MLYTSIAFLAAAGAATAQSMRPNSTSICDYYTTALLKDNSAANQMKLLTLVVNTAVIGNYTMPNVGIKVPGILAPGKFNGVDVNLLPYFDGGLKSTNDGTSMTGVAMNFLDDGGAVPLTMNMPANGTSSNQYMLLTHLYEYFGVLLGCTMVGKPGYPAYAGGASQYEIHKFMNLDANQVGYFITQVGLSAASFGVAKEDVTAVGMALNKLFGYKCSPPTTVIPEQGPQLQSICSADSCPKAPMNATCPAGMIGTPMVANATLAMGEGTNSTANSTTNGTMSSATPSAPATVPAKGMGAAVGVSLTVLAAAAFALVL